MSNTIRFLEEVGRTPVIPAGSYQELVAALNVEDEEREALLGRNATRLADLLGGRAAMAMHIVSPDGDAAEEAPDEGEVERPQPDERPGTDERQI